MTHKFYTVDEVADMLGIHSNTVRRMIAGRRLTAVKVEGVWRVSQVAIDAYLEARTIKART